MKDSRQIPHLLKLLDEEDPASRDAIQKALHDFGPALRIEIAKMQVPPDVQQRHLLQKAMMQGSREEFEKAWPAWNDHPPDQVSLEAALSLVSDYLTGYIYPEGLSTDLNRLADAYHVHSAKPSAMDLAQYLFTYLGFKGATQDFYHPLQSDLCHVIHTRQGIPISLTCIYILVGQRCGLDIGGCNFPGHFLARIEEGGTVKLVDCFNGGKIVDHKVVASMSEQTPWGVQKALQQAAPAQSIITRVLSNLLRAFQEVDQPQDAALITRLLTRQVSGGESGPVSNPFSAGEILQAAQPLYHTGQLVRHRHYGYRGVIVDFDMRCKADDSWYKRNRTQPNKEQPWYHVLIDQTDQATYAAQSSLLADDSQDEVFHPLVPQYFDKFVDGRYVRNDTPWAGL